MFRQYALSACNSRSYQLPELSEQSQQEVFIDQMGHPVGCVNLNSIEQSAPEAGAHAAQPQISLKESAVPPLNFAILALPEGSLKRPLARQLVSIQQLG